MTSESTTKKQLQRLQRAIVDGLEDVKGQDIVVFNTEELSPLFERVIVASGTSNRQTRALAASVCDAVRDAGFSKPRVEGEDNGEWIIVDCGQVVAHVMQPVIRQYYRLEEIWGAKPVRLRHGAEKVKASVDAQATAAPARKTRAPAKASAMPAKPARPAKAAPRAAAAAGTPAKPKRAAAKTGAAAAPAKRKTTRAQAPMAKLVVNKPKAGAKPAARKAATGRPAAKKSAS